MSQSDSLSIMPLISGGGASFLHEIFSFERLNCGLPTNRTDSVIKHINNTQSVGWMKTPVRLWHFQQSTKCARCGFYSPGDRRERRRPPAIEPAGLGTLRVLGKPRPRAALRSPAWLGLIVTLNSKSHHLTGLRTSRRIAPDRWWLLLLCTAESNHKDLMLHLLSLSASPRGQQFPGGISKKI